MRNRWLRELNAVFDIGGAQPNFFADGTTSTLLQGFQDLPSDRVGDCVKNESEVRFGSFHGSPKINLGLTGVNIGLDLEGVNLLLMAPRRWAGLPSVEVEGAREARIHIQTDARARFKLSHYTRGALLLQDWVVSVAYQLGSRAFGILDLGERPDLNVEQFVSGNRGGKG
jgi:hypothetical protein